MSSNAPADEHAATGAPEEDDLEIWGWHHTFHKGAQVGGWITAAILLLMTIGNHEGHVEDLWLLGIALIMAAVLGADIIERRKAWRR